MVNIIGPNEFDDQLMHQLASCTAKCVTGPGRSGAVAAVYASYRLGIPFIPYGEMDLPDKLKPILIIDTALKSGRTLRKAMKKYSTNLGIAVYNEITDGRVHFWYEYGNNTTS